MKYLKLYESVNEKTFEEWFGREDEDVSPITSLGCNHANLTSLKGIERLPNLRFFSCSYNNLTSLEGIENLKNLKELHCYKNKLTSLKGVENLANLEKLFCEYNPITSLKELENCTNLLDIECCDMQLTSLAPLGNCKKLYRILCQRNFLTNLDEIEDLHLQTLVPDHNPFKNPIPYKITKNFEAGYITNDIDKFATYAFQKDFLEEHPEKIRDLIYIGFHRIIIEKYKELLDFFGIKSRNSNNSIS